MSNRRLKWDGISENAKEYRYLNEQVLVVVNVIISGIVTFAGGYFVISRAYKDSLQVLILIKEE